MFWLGLMGLVLFYAKLDWVAGPGAWTWLRSTQLHAGHRLPAAGCRDGRRVGCLLGNALSHLILPASLLGYFSMAYISRMTRSFMLNELAQEYVIAARARASRKSRIIWRHACRNAMVPLVTVIALSMPGCWRARC